MLNAEFPTSLKIQHWTFTTQHSQLRVALSYHADFFMGNGDSDPKNRHTCRTRPS